MSETQRQEAFFQYIMTLKDQDVPESRAATFQAGWDAAMRCKPVQAKTPPEPQAHQ